MCGPESSDTEMDSGILLKLQQVFPDTASYRTEASIIQANAQGYKLELLPTGKRVFYKCIVASDFLETKKDWPDLRRTLIYARTEVRFYSEILPDLQKRGFDAVPRVFLAQCRLDGWIDETEHATQECSKENAAINIKQLLEPETKGGFILLDCVADAHYFQESPLSIEQCKLCLEAVAKLHASAWQDKSLLEKINGSLSRASFHLRMRNPKELAGIVDAWNGFYRAFEKPFEDECNLVWTDALRDMGRRTKAVAEYVSAILSPSPSDRYATLVHGDYKSLNVFLPRDPLTHNALLVDWASCGIGLGMSDVAMHIHHAVLPHLLEEGGEEALVRHYWQQLNTLTNSEYAWDEAWRHYQFGVVDYFRFFLARMWNDATPESLAQKKDNKNVNLINRDLASACAFLVVAEKFMTTIENEMGLQCER
ncbi:hypothetical protein MPSEU_000684200 [Mayamaea pseudoterrestris]|nr:hypothetical protein MPSEU_000684200 [Mayamaea pseudoterrestris]